ncbi:MAG: c-type cytochrome [Myxococcota bacterium]
MEPELTATDVSMSARETPSYGDPAAKRDLPDVDPAHLAEGRRMYAQYCALCHGGQGEGYAADNANALNHPKFLAVASNAFLRDAIANGRPGTPMSAWSRRSGGPLSGSDIHRLVTYIRSWQTEPSAELEVGTITGDPERGGALYGQHCAACHGADGSGITAIGISNPRFLASASDGYLRYAIEHGRPGTPMPAFKDRFSEPQIRDVVTYIRSWERALPTGDPVEDLDLDYGNVVIHPEGADPTLELREGLYVSSAQVYRALREGKKMVLLDARPTSDWHQNHLPGAYPVPFYEMEPMIDALPKDGTMIVAYCACPHAASGKVVRELRARDFPATAVLDEGIHFWMEQGYPVRSGSEP